VFLNPAGVDEDSPTPMTGLHAYGRHRRRLEQIVAGRFNAHVVRLPGLFGPGLKKNVIYDLVHDHELHKIDSRGEFQFYEVRRLWRDIEAAIDADLHLVHLPPEPVSVADVARAAVGIEFTNELPPPPARYDVRTKYATAFGGSGCYTQARTEELARIAAFVADERRANG
jgi:nucleoside-diphosphate-sugar epimerase